MRNTINLNILSFEKRKLISVKDILKTIFILLVTTGLAKLFNFLSKGVFLPSEVSVIYILGLVVISCWTTSYIYGIISSFISVFAVYFFFSYQHFEVNATFSDYNFTFFVMLVISLITSTLTAKMIEEARVSRIREARANLLYNTVMVLISKDTVEGIAQYALECLFDSFEFSGLFYIGDPTNVDTIQYKKDRHNKFYKEMKAEETLLTAYNVYNSQSIVKTIISEEKVIIFFPIKTFNRNIGVICLFHENTEIIIDDNISFLKILISQFSMGIYNILLNNERNKVIMEKEKEKIRGNLLRSIAHDLRTPLTAISGISSTLLENSVNINPNQFEDLIKNIYDDSQWLIRIVENLLSVTRIDDEAAKVKKSPEAVEEIVGESICRLKSRYPDIDIHVKVPDELLIVPMDGTLIEQVIINIIENSIRHSQKSTSIHFNVIFDDFFAKFEIRDTGNGISEDVLNNLSAGIFKSRETPNETTGGFGIGLSICKTIIESHSGNLNFANHPEGGAIVTFTLPIGG